jgi:TRAP-type mannitol/chloroaromatic compound transport system substrate-binding protein
MDRRSFLKTTGVAAGATAASAVAAPAIAQGVKELKLVMSWPKGFPGLGTAPERFARRFEAATEGRYKVRIYGGGELVPALKTQDAVQEGTADMYHSAEYYFQGKTPAFSFFAAVPFGFRPDEMDAWLHHGGGQELWDELAADFNVKPFLCGNTGSQMAGWFNKDINSVEDFKGLKMRIPGLGGDVIRALGGSPVTLAGAEILPALQSGTIDATEWVGPYNDLAFGIYKIVKNYYYPGFHEPGTALSLGVNRELYESMSDTDKAALRASSIAENNIGLAEFNANNSKALNTLVNEHGVNLREMPDEVFVQAGKAAKDVIAEAGNADAMTKKVYDSYTAFRQIALDWSKLSDQSYMRKRELAEG